MKRSYFDTLRVDSDDELHFRAIEEGLVPELCLMGGATIYWFAEKGKNVCHGCPWDRKLCGSKEPYKGDELSKPAEVTKATMEAVEARKLEHAQWIRDILDKETKG